MSDIFNIGIAGLGTVGVGTIELLRDNADVIAKRCGKSVRVVAVSARDKSKDRGIDTSGITWYDNAVDMADDDSVDIVVELIGGSEGAAKELVEKSLANGKHVVTANKALIAHHGVALAKLAEEKQVNLAFEAAVAGGIPIIDALRNGLSANQFSIIAGIMNGTGNYILTTMHKEGREFDDVLKEAQDLGYAEADPSFDVDGIDTAHKLAIITSLAYGTKLDLDSITCEGIRSISKQDMLNASELGYTIKLLGITEQTDAGIRQRVHPCMVPADAPIGVIDGAFNAIHLQGNAVGRVLLEGAGAGAGPTASSVVADIVQIARGMSGYALMVKADELEDKPAASLDDLLCSYYLRLTVKDEAGVLSDITALLNKANISVQSLIQHDHTPDSPAQIVITTHDVREATMRQVLQQIASLDSVIEQPQRLRIESLQ